MVKVGDIITSDLSKFKKLTEFLENGWKLKKGDLLVTIEASPASITVKNGMIVEYLEEVAHDRELIQVRFSGEQKDKLFRRRFAVYAPAEVVLKVHPLLPKRVALELTGLIETNKLILKRKEKRLAFLNQNVKDITEYIKKLENLLYIQDIKN